MRDLNLGVTSKRDDDDSTGYHGEGLKLAALVMLRNGHSLRLGSNSFSWNFSLRGRSGQRDLRCWLRQKNPALMQRQTDEYDRKKRAPRFVRSLKANIWEDTTVIVGKAKIRESDFRAWLNVALDLHWPPPSEIIQTRMGDLLLAAGLKGRIYLKGLRIDGEGPDGKDYAYGYNFIVGKINRDRERLISRGEEHKMLAAIWAEAIREKGDDIIDRYITLFEKHEKCADISMAHNQISRPTTERIWTRLRKRSPGAFFYSDKELTEPTSRTDVSSSLLVFTETKSINSATRRTLLQGISEGGLKNSPRTFGKF